MMSLILFPLLLLTLTSHNDEPDFSIDGIGYEVCTKRVDKDKVVTLDTVRVVAVSEIPSSGSLTIPEKVDFGGSVYIVGRIGWDSFKDCKPLRNLVLPPTVNDISSAAFDGCENLESVNIPDGVEDIPIWCFRNCGRLRSIVLPPSVTKVKGGAFEKSGLRELTLGEGVGYMNGYEVFVGTMNLDRITVRAKDFRLRDIRANVFDFKGESVVFETENLGSKKVKTRINHLVLSGATHVFAPWKNGKIDKFASDCTVYVPDHLVNDFRSSSDWKPFKEIKPISSYKQK